MKASFKEVTSFDIGSSNSIDSTPRLYNPSDIYSVNTMPDSKGLTKTVHQLLKQVEDTAYSHLILNHREADLIYTDSVKRQIISHKFLSKLLLTLYKVKGKKISRLGFNQQTRFIDSASTYYSQGIKYLIVYIDLNPDNLPNNLVLSFRTPRATIEKDDSGYEYLNSYVLVFNANLTNTK